MQDGTPITQTGAIVGTPSYMSPEQAAGSRGTLGPASDVYSLGAVLYEILTGQPPFRASSPFDTLLLVLDRDVVPPRVLNRRVDPLLEMICLKCLQKPSDLRYATAAALAADLRAYLDGSEISARSGGISSLFGHFFRDTHNAAVLENWGLLWITHSFKLLALVLVTIAMYRFGFHGHLPYLVLWSDCLDLLGPGLWWLRAAGRSCHLHRTPDRPRLGGRHPGSISIFLAEWVYGLPVLSMAPGLAIVAAMVYLMKAGMLSGRLYIWVALYVLTSIAMACLPNRPEVQLLLFGLVAWASFFFPGLKYYRLRHRQEMALQ